MVRTRIFSIAVCGVALVLSSACGTRQATKPAAERAPECRIAPASPVTGDRPVTFALLDPVDLGRAPWAGRTSDRVLFGHLYETLVTIDCMGEVRPCLAESWTSAKEDRVWKFALRRGARFWDGAPVTASDVVASWQDALTLDTVIDSVSAPSDWSLHVYLKRPCRQLPRVLSASLYAATKPAGDSRWVMGSGPYRIGSVDRVAYPEVRRTITVCPAFGLSGPVVRFVETPADRVRDGLESTIDAVVTCDPAVIEYAAARPQFATVALPWEKTYVLLSTSRARGPGDERHAAALSSDLLDALARDAVRGDARGYRAPSWWEALAGCEASPAAVPGSSSGPHEPSAVRETGASGRARRIVYDSSDTVARGLAERIAALSAADTTRSAEARAFASALPGLCSSVTALAAVGLTRGEFERGLKRGDEFAYVTALPRQPADPCYEALALKERAPWLLASARVLADVLVPLADARSHLIVRKDTVELELGGNGSILVVPRGARTRRNER